uniref:NUMOD4 domain-containing protein n=1 Tax=viral metagenome TaxID=1070528 RepID=A0A6C0C744_9ZZZZ
MEEEYRPIVGYEGRYGISKAGEIYSFVSNKTLKIQVNSAGYRIISLNDDAGNRCKRYVHVLVASTYLKKNGSRTSSGGSYQWRQI